MNKNITNIIIKPADWNLRCKVEKNNFGFTEKDVIKILLFPVTLK